MPAIDPETLRHRLVTLTRDLILIPSTVDRPADIDRVMEFMGNHIDLPGIHIEEFRSNGSPSLLYLPNGIERPEILLNGHVDVVSLPEGHYRSEIRDNRIIGPGAGDMKAALAVLLDIFGQLHEKHPGVSLGLLITADEERGGHDGVDYLLDSVGLRCGSAMIPDGGSLNEIVLEEKGILHLQVMAQGRASHAARPWLGENALEKIHRFHSRLRDLFDTFPAQANHFQPTASLSIVRTSNPTTNRVPDEAEATYDIRFPAGYTVDEMFERIGKIAGDEVTFEKRLHAESCRFDPDPLFLQVTEQITGRPARTIKAHGGSDARFFSRMNIPVICSRPNVGELHTQNEWVEIDSLLKFWQIYQTYLTARLVAR